MRTPLLATLALLAGSGSSPAQNFNVDFGDPASPPSSTYAAAGSAGYWTTVGAENDHFYALRDLDGNATGVVIHTRGSAGLLTSNDASVTGDDAALMNDGAITYIDAVDNS